MTTYTFTSAAHFDGPAESYIEAQFAVTFTHQRAEPENNAHEGVSIDSIEILVGGERVDFNGNHDDPALITACWQHIADERDRVESQRADYERDERVTR